MMKIDIKAKRLALSAKVQEFSENKVRNALARFDERISRVTLWLSDTNGSKGGSDKNCQVHIVMHGKSDVVIEETRGNLYKAINRAIERAGHAVVRKVKRQQTRSKRSGQMLPAFAEPV